MDHLTTEQRNPKSAYLDLLSAREIAELMNGEDQLVATAVAEQLQPIAVAIELIAKRLAAGGRLFYLGAGTSGRLGVLDASECPPTFRTPPELVVGLIAGGRDALTQAIEGAEDRGELAITDLQSQSFAPADVLVGIATSGRTPYVVAGLQYARSLGAATIGLTCNPSSDLDQVAEHSIRVVVGPEILSGSTRLKAGTATKLVLNMLSTGAMVLLGKTYGNLMVDLRATNQKLRARSVRIVRELTGLSEGEAAERLTDCDGEVKTAIVAARCQLTPQRAREQLQSVGGRLRAALAESKLAVATATPGLILGVDGGGSKTVAWLAQSSPHDSLSAQADSAARDNVLGIGRAGPGNLRRGPASQIGGNFWLAVAEIERAIEMAFREAGLPRTSVAAACLGLAGAGAGEIRQRLSAWATATGIAEQVHVVGDVELVLPAAFGERRDVSGIALIAGTGSIAWGRDRAGRVARAGGWGSRLGDDGSAYAIGWSAIRTAVRAGEGLGGSTQLLSRFSEAVGARDLAEFVAWAQAAGERPAAIAALASIVIEAATDDPLAQAIVDNAAAELTRLAEAVAERLQFAAGNFDVVLAGGLFTHQSKFRSIVESRLAAGRLRPAQVRLVEHPVVGALRLADNLVKQISRPQDV